MTSNVPVSGSGSQAPGAGGWQAISLGPPKPAPMELRRRDALAALAAAGVAAGGVATLADRDDDDGSQPLGRREVDTLVAVAEVVYPGTVDGIPEFVETYSVTRARARPDYGEGVAAALATLDDVASDWYDGDVRTLDRETRDRLLRELGCDAADPDPDGTTAERLRYYLVNELLYALYTTPTGGALVGLENPQGHPGGTESYQQAPDR